MGFWKKLCCWRRTRNVAVRTREISTETENVNSENAIQVSSIDISVKCDTGTQVASNVTCERRPPSTETNTENIVGNEFATPPAAAER